MLGLELRYVGIVKLNWKNKMWIIKVMMYWENEDERKGLMSCGLGWYR